MTTKITEITKFQAKKMLESREIKFKHQDLIKEAIVISDNENNVNLMQATLSPIMLYYKKEIIDVIYTYDKNNCKKQILILLK